VQVLHARTLSAIAGICRFAPARSGSGELVNPEGLLAKHGARARACRVQGQGHCEQA